MKLQNLKDVYVDALKDIYNAENQLTKALPKLAKAANAPELKQAFETHLEQTRHQIERLDEIFDQLGTGAKGKRCRGMEGIVEEGAEMIEADGDLSVIDAGLIAAAQKAEHYEIANYGCVRTWAEMLGESRAAQLLKETLDEESATDEKLTQLAERIVNPEAVHAPDNPRSM